MPLLPLVIGVI